MGGRRLTAKAESLALKAPFRISGYTFTTAEALTVTVEEDGRRGRGEAAGVYFLGEDLVSMRAEVEGVRAAVEAGVSREALQALLPPGGARNALDCALWELEAVTAGEPVWRRAGVPAPRPLRTTFTLSADTPEAMAQGARDYGQARAIKVKLTGELELDVARVRAIRDARPDVWLGVDGNQGFAADDLPALLDALVEARVSLLEQPLPRGRDAELEGLGSPIPVAGDESLLSREDVAGAVGRFDVVNIKLDKCGGLTEGLRMAAEARRLGLGVMVGNMVGTSLAMAPAFVLGQLCDVVDLDGPIALARDSEPGVRYRDGDVWAGPEVWGGPDPASPAA